MERINTQSFLCSENNFSMFRDHHGSEVSEFNVGFLPDQHSLQGFKPGFGVGLDSFPPSYSVLSKIQKSSFMDWESGALCRVGVSQLPAYSAWWGPVYFLSCFTSYRFRKAFRLSNNSRVMLEITAMNYVKHVLLLPGGQFILETQLCPSSSRALEPITGLLPVVSCMLCM